MFTFQKDKYVRIWNMKYVRISKGEKHLCCGEICPFVSLSSCLYIRFHASILHFDNLQEFFPSIWHQNIIFILNLCYWNCKLILIFLKPIMIFLWENFDFSLETKVLSDKNGWGARSHQSLFTLIFFPQRNILFLFKDF